MESKLKPAKVKKVVSGDTFVLLGPINAKTGLPHELLLSLYGIKCPRMDKMEPFCRESKDFLRKLIAGKDVQFSNFVMPNKSQQCHVYLDGKDVALTALAAGYASPDENAPTNREPADYDDYWPAYESAKSATKGMWSGKEFKYGKKGALPTDIEALFKATKDKTLTGYIDDIEFNFAFKIYLAEHDATIPVIFKGITIPIIGADHAKSVRTFIFRNFIQKDITFKVSNEFSKDKEALVVEEEMSEHSVAVKFLRAGFARMESGAAMKLDHGYFVGLKNHEDFAKQNKSVLWKDFAGPTGGAFQKTTFDAVVIEIHSGDSLTIANTTNEDAQRVYLSNVKAPNPGNAHVEGSTQPWAWEGKEFLRNMLIGKTIRCELEFKREIPIKDDAGGVKKTLHHQCSSLFLEGKNIAVAVLQHGFAKCNLPRGDDPFTPYLKEMTDAEEEAKTKTIGVHSKKTPNQHNYWDLTTQESRKKIRSFNLSQLQGNVNGVCEYVFNGARLKVRVDTEQYFINFQCNGIKALGNDQNMPLRGQFAQDAIKFARSTLVQRNVKMDIESVDKYGICHGILYINNKNYGQSLVAQGLGYLSLIGRPSKIHGELEKTQQAALTGKVGMWSKFTPEALDIKTKATLSECNETWRAAMVEMTDPHEFYLHNVDSSQLPEIEEKIQIEYDRVQKLAPPIMDRTVCLAPFDGGLYRCHVLRKIKDDRFQLQFIDYGNKEIISSEELYKIPPSVAYYKPQAVKCSLAYVECAPRGHDLQTRALDVAYKMCWEKKLVAHTVYRDDEFHHVVLNSHNMPEIENSLNYTLLESAYARVSPYVPPKGDLADDLNKLEGVATDKNPAILNVFREEEY
jgi:staphylococcal nuclease domain-containing protein 1